MNFYNIQNGLIVSGNVTASTYYGYLDWNYLTNKPTTASGYSITDVYTTAQTNALYVYKTGDTMSGNLYLPALSATTV